MKQRQSIKILTKWEEPLDLLSQSEKGEIFKAIVKYSFHDEIPILSDKLKKDLELERNLHKLYFESKHYPKKIFGGMHECFSEYIPFYDGLKLFGELK